MFVENKTKNSVISKKITYVSIDASANTVMIVTN